MRDYYQRNKQRFQEYQRQTRDRRNARRRERYANDAEYRAECIRLSKQRDKESIRDYRLRKSFGITAAEYDALLAEQQGGCAICGTSESAGVSQRLHVDHDHESGDVRGLLCSECNLGLGKFRDNPDLLRIAIEYLS